VLSYLYDTEELTHAELLASKEESAQYSLHAVGLVFDQSNRRIIVADPNGALVPGSNMEFVQIPLTSRSTSSTSVSQFDLDSIFRNSKRRKINN
jgi:cytidine deaminase